MVVLEGRVPGLEGRLGEGRYREREVEESRVTGGEGRRREREVEEGRVPGPKVGAGARVCKRKRL